MCQLTVVCLELSQYYQSICVPGTQLRPRYTRASWSLWRLAEVRGQQRRPYITKTFLTESFKMMNSPLTMYKNRMVIFCSERRSISLADISFLFIEIGTKSQYYWRPGCGKAGHTFLTGCFLQRQLVGNYQMGKRIRAKGLKQKIYGNWLNQK